MKSSIVPPWSFLAVEPSVRLVLRREPQLAARMLGRRSLARSASAFWELFSHLEREIAKSKPHAIGDRHRLAIQCFYAIVDLTELQGASDREIQSRLRAVLAHPNASMACSAVVAMQARPVSVA